MWALFSCIIELPPSIRYSIENIIFHSTFSGADPEFNNFLSVYNKEIDEILLDGIGPYTIKIHATTGDAPALAKVCKISQFNGYNSCIKCMHPGLYLDRKMVFPNHEKVEARTPNMYKTQVKEAIKTSHTYLGIKGPAHLSSWLPFPDHILIDYMHCCCLGTFKSTFLKLFLTSNYQEPWYLGKNSVNIDKILLNISLPKEFGRGIRSINDRHHYKANEFRTIAMYIAYGCLKGLLADRYLRLFLSYSIFLRLLCQEAVSNEDICDAQLIIEAFSVEYENIFSKQAMTFNLHMHLHLAKQVYHNNTNTTLLLKNSQEIDKHQMNLLF